MSYDMIGVELGRALSQWGLNRLQQQDNDKRIAELRAQEIEDEERRWKRMQEREAPAIRTIRVQNPDGSFSEVDQQQNYDPDTRSVSFTPIGEPRPLMAEPSKARRVRIVSADGQPMMHPEDEPLPEGARFYERPQAARGGGRGAAADKPAKPPGASYQVVRDPDFPNKWTTIDRTTGEYETDAQGRRIEAAPPYRERQKPKDTSKSWFGGALESMAESAGTFANAAEAQARKGKSAPLMGAAAAPTDKAGESEQPVEIKTDKNGKKWKIYADGTMEPA